MGSLEYTFIGAAVLLVLTVGSVITAPANPAWGTFFVLCGIAAGVALLLQYRAMKRDERTRDAREAENRDRLDTAVSLLRELALKHAARPPLTGVVTGSCAIPPVLMPGTLKQKMTQLAEEILEWLPLHEAQLRAALLADIERDDEDKAYSAAYDDMNREYRSRHEPRIRAIIAELGAGAAMDPRLSIYENPGNHMRMRLVAEGLRDSAKLLPD